MSGNVFALPNASIPSYDAIPDIVEICEKALADAKSGKLIGIAIVTVERDPIANEFVFHTQQCRHTLMAGVLGLNWKLGEYAVEGGNSAT
jgi:hypothetical protein